MKKLTIIMLLITLFLFSCNNNLKQNEENCKKLIEQRENILYYYSQYPNISEKLIKSTDSLILCNCIIKDTVKPEYPKYLKIGKQEGAEMYESSCPLPKKGFWCRPTIFTNVAQSNRIAQEEIFGPVLSVLTFRTDDEVIEKANNSPYGLSAGVWTDKGSKIFNMTKRMRAGVIWANTFNKFDPTSPFGGYKESGFGREGGLHGLLPYLNLVN